MDLGTGDGRHVLARAAAAPDELVVGVDASASAMADASRRAARGRLANAVFVAADASSLPDGLAGFADLVTIHFPWGSLLHGAAGADPCLTRLLAPGATLRLLLSASPTDAGAGLVRLDPVAIERAYRAAGLEVVISQRASFDDARAAHSSWGKRLLRNAGTNRTAWLLEAVAPLSQEVNPAAARRSPPRRPAKRRSSRFRPA
jgi:16S rRNA (adenine(1408)-N(1))-methyltransferase